MTLWLNKSRHNGYPRLAFWVPPELWLNHLLLEKDTQDTLGPGQKKLSLLISKQLLKNKTKNWYVRQAHLCISKMAGDCL